MKTYQKPKLIALSISGNSPLCACAIDIIGDNMDPVFKQTLDDLKIIFPDVDEDTNHLFLATEGCKSAIPIEGYCKMSPNQDNVVFNS